MNPHITPEQPLGKCWRSEPHSTRTPDRPGAEAELISIAGEEHWAVNRGYRLDVPALAHAARQYGEVPEPDVGEHRFRLLYKHGFAELVRSTDHEETAHFVAHPSPAPQLLPDAS